MKWIYKIKPFTIEIEFSNSGTRASQLYGYLESLVTIGDHRILRKRTYVTGTTLDHIEDKARSLSKDLAISAANELRDFPTE